MVMVLLLLVLMMQMVVSGRVGCVRRVERCVQDKVFRFGNGGQQLPAPRVVGIAAHEKVHNLALLLALELRLERQVVRVQFALVLLAGADLVEGELFHRLDGVVAGEQQRQQLVGRCFLGDEQRLVLGVGLERGGVNPYQTAGLLLKTKPEQRRKWTRHLVLCLICCTNAL